jgi:hypothetical protein
VSTVRLTAAQALGNVAGVALALSEVGTTALTNMARAVLATTNRMPALQQLKLPGGYDVSVNDALTPELTA